MDDYPKDINVKKVCGLCLHLEYRNMCNHGINNKVFKSKDTIACEDFKLATWLYEMCLI